jgi:hypothetical protein
MPRCDPAHDCSQAHDHHGLRLRTGPCCRRADGVRLTASAVGRLEQCIRIDEQGVRGCTLTPIAMPEGRDRPSTLGTPKVDMTQHPLGRLLGGLLDYILGCSPWKHLTKSAVCLSAEAVKKLYLYESFKQYTLIAVLCSRREGCKSGVCNLARSPFWCGAVRRVSVDSTRLRRKSEPRSCWLCRANFFV